MIFNDLGKVSKTPYSFDARGRHSNLYPVDLPGVLDKSVKDELVKRFSILLLKDLVSLLNQDGSNPKHETSKSESSASDVSQPESVAFSINSSLGGKIDPGRSTAHWQDYTGTSKTHQSSERVEHWVKSSFNLDSEQSEQPESSK